MAGRKPLFGDVGSLVDPKCKIWQPLLEALDALATNTNSNISQEINKAVLSHILTNWMEVVEQITKDTGQSQSDIINQLLAMVVMMSARIGYELPEQIPDYLIDMIGDAMQATKDNEKVHLPKKPKRGKKKKQ